MKGYIFITSSGTDPLAGKHLKDPTLEGRGSFGACQPQLRARLEKDDFLFVVSGSLRRKHFKQYIVGGLQVDRKIHATDAYKEFPGQRLHTLSNGSVTGNIICDAEGNPHPLDNHTRFEKRLQNYVIGKEAIALRTEGEVARGREQTMDILQSVFHKQGRIPQDVIGRCSRLDKDQIEQMVYHLRRLKSH